MSITIEPFKTTIILTFIIALSCCKPNNTNNKKTTKTDNQAHTVNIEEINKQVTGFVYPLPTTFEMAQILNENNISYILSLSNPTSNVEKYFTQKQKALNLGIYGTDLSYAITYNQKQIAVDYIKVSNQLIDELNFSHIIDNNIITQLQQNEGNKDEIINIISNTFFNTYKFLNHHERGEVAAQIITGSWIEALYIATHITHDTYANPNLLKLINEQKEPLSKLLEIYASFGYSEPIKQIETDLLKIHTVYNNDSLTQQQLNTITKEVEVIRKKYIQ